MKSGESLLLDSTAAIDILNCSPRALDVSKAHPGLVMNPIVLGEVLYGARLSNSVEANLEAAWDFTADCEFVSISERTADFYSQAQHSLRKIGRMIPTNDLWIAALALEHALPLMTNDRHFAAIPGLQTVGW